MPSGKTFREEFSQKLDELCEKEGLMPTFAHKKIAILEARVSELVDQWSIMARACGNWREFPGHAITDHDHPDWQAAARAILERDAIARELEKLRSADSFGLKAIDGS